MYVFAVVVIVAAANSEIGVQRSVFSVQRSAYNVRCQHPVMAAADVIERRFT